MSTLKLWKAYEPAPDIRRAEKGAAGTMPVAAFQFCEAMRKASAFGWYVYPPKDISLLFDGRETFFHEDDQWFPLKSTNLEDAFRTSWQGMAPDALKPLDPPFLSSLFVPGAIQIWSGYFVETAPDWSVLVRSIPNYDTRSSISLFEGIVETGTFKPWPLFINLRLVATDVEIFIPRDFPLFQLQAVPRIAFDQQEPGFMSVNGMQSEDAPFDWDGAHRTIRDASKADERRPGTYAVQVRKGD